MIFNLKYLHYSQEDKTYHIKSTNLFNKKEIDKLKSAVITKEIVSGDVVYLSDYLLSDVTNRKEFKNDCKKLLINDKKIVSGSLSPEKSTLFVINNDIINNFLSYISNYKESSELFNCISTDDNNWENFKTINIDFIDYPISMLEIIFPELIQDKSIYVLGDVPDDCIVVKNLLRGMSIEHPLQPILETLYQLLRSEYSPRVIQKNDFVVAIKRFKTSMSRDEYLFLKSVKHSDESLYNQFLSNYSIKDILNNSSNDPISYFYTSLITAVSNTHDNLFDTEYDLRNLTHIGSVLDYIVNTKNTVAIDDYLSHISNNLFGKDSFTRNSVTVDFIVYPKIRNLDISLYSDIKYHTLSDTDVDSLDNQSLPF